MAWYEGTFSCGHEGRVNIIGPNKDRQWKIDYHFSGLCPECYEKERQEKIERENMKAAQEAQKMELPDLEGTDKQVPWANTLRLKFIEKMEDIIKVTMENSSDAVLYQKRVVKELKDYGIKEIPQHKEIPWFFEELLQYSLTEKTSASYWIIVRNENIFERTVELANERSSRYSDKDIPKEILTEATVAPEEAIHPGIVKITGNETYIKAYYIKDDDFRTIVKNYGFFWDGVWKRDLDEYTGSYIDRAAELGNALLRNGFTVQILDSQALQNAVSGMFQPECRRWIKYNEKVKKIVLQWPRDDQSDIYTNSLKLPGAKWYSEYRGVLVKVDYYREIMDFADCYGFHFSKAAKAYIDQYVQEELKIERVFPVIPEERVEIDKLKEKLKYSGAIITDLMDGE